MQSEHPLDRPAADDSDTRLERVDAVLAEVAERLRRGEPTSAEQIYAEHPDLEAELRLVLPRALSLERAAAQAAVDAPLLYIGRYRVVRELGRGGMGVVYEAIDEELGRKVAVKWISPGISGDEHYLERFRREAQAAARLSHENVVQVHEVGQCAGRPFFAMQLVAGHSLDVLVRGLRGRDSGASADSRQAAREFATRKTAAPPGRSGESGEPGDRDRGGAGAAPADEPPVLGRTYHRAVARMGVQVARALEYAHEHGVLHRDIKPGNILVDGNGRAWVADFGLAKLEDAGDMTRGGDLVGTLRYMAPEQFQGNADARTDVYGLGLALFELLTLEPAFQGGSRETLIRSALYQRPPRIRSIRPEVPQDLERIVFKAIAKIPGERYRTAEAMASDLEAFLDGRPITARMPGLLYLVRLAVARNRPLAWLVLAISLFAAVGVPAYVLQLQERNRTEKRLAYLGNLAGASAALQSGDVTGARKRLEACGEGQRGWEWRHLHARIDQSSATLGKFGSSIVGIRADEEGLTVVRARDVDRFEDSEWTPILRGSSMPLRDAWSSPSGWRVLDGVGALFGGLDLGGEPLLRLGRGYASCHALARDDSTLAVFSFEGGLYIVDSAAPTTISEMIAAFTPTALVLSADGRRLWGVTNEGLLFTRDGSDEEPRVVYEDPAPLRAVALSVDEQRVAISGEQDSILVLDTLDMHVVHALIGHADAVKALQFSPDGTRLYSAGRDTTIRVWDLESGDPVRTLRGHARPVSALAVGADGERLFSGSHGGVVKEWDVRCAGGLTSLTGHVRDVGALSISSSGSQVATGDRGGTIRIHDLASERLDELLLGHSQAVSTLQFHAAGRRLASGSYDRNVIDWDVVRGVERWRVDLGRQVILTAISSDECTLYAGTTAGSIVALSAEDGTRLRVYEPDTELRLRCGASSPHAGLLLLGWEDGSITLLDERTLQPAGSWQAHAEQVESIEFDPTGETMVTASSDGTIARWSFPAHTLLFRRLLENDGLSKSSEALTDACFSPDGSLIAVASHGTLVRLVTAEGGDPILDLAEHSDWVRAVAFTPDGELLISAGSDARVNLWSTRSTGEKRVALAARLQLEEEGRTWLEGALEEPIASVRSINRALELLASSPHEGEDVQRAVMGFVHGQRDEYLLEYWIDAVLNDPSRYPQAEAYLNQWELQSAGRPGPPTLAAAVELARGQAGVSLERAHLARQRLDSDRPAPLLTYLEARAHASLGDPDEAATLLERARRELSDPALEASRVRVRMIEGWLGQ